MGVSSCDLFKSMVDVAKKNNIVHQIEVSDCGTNELIISNEEDNGTKNNSDFHYLVRYSYCKYYCI